MLEDLVLQSILFKIEKSEKDDNFFDTRIEEEIISNEIEKYVIKDEMLMLPIPVLEQIFHSFYSSKKWKGKASK